MSLVAFNRVRVKVVTFRQIHWLRACFLSWGARSTWTACASFGLLADAYHGFRLLKLFNALKYSDQALIAQSFSHFVERNL